MEPWKAYNTNVATKLRVVQFFWEDNCLATVWGEYCEDVFSSESIAH